MALKAIEVAYLKKFDEAKMYEDLYHKTESMRLVADGHVDELIVLVNAMEERGLVDSRKKMETLAEENLTLMKHYDVSL